MNGLAGRLRAPWWAMLLAVAGVALGTTAGLWQLDRAGQKRELYARFAAGADAAPLERLPADAEAPGLRYRRLRLAGSYDPAHQVLLDNMSYEGQPGYQVLTPFATAGGTVLVNRGWVPASGDRSRLPDIAVGAEPREVTGRIESLPRPGIRLGATAPPADAPWPRRLLFPTVADISAQSGTVLPNYQLLLEPAAADGYVRDWHPGGMPPERHLAYAVQWFGLALTVSVIYVVLALRNERQGT